MRFVRSLYATLLMEQRKREMGLETPGESLRVKSSTAIYDYLRYDVYIRSSVAPLGHGLHPAAPWGPVVGVDWCECWLMES